jgi:hypothetical protein
MRRRRRRTRRRRRRKSDVMVGQSHPSGFIAAHSGFLELKLSNCQGRPTSRPTRRHVLCFFWQTLYIYIYLYLAVREKQQQRQTTYRHFTEEEKRTLAQGNTAAMILMNEEVFDYSHVPKRHFIMAKNGSMPPNLPLTHAGNTPKPIISGVFGSGRNIVITRETS